MCICTLWTYKNCMQKQHPWTSESDGCKGENDEFCQRMGEGKRESSVGVHAVREAAKDELQIIMSIP